MTLRRKKTPAILESSRVGHELIAVDLRIQAIVIMTAKWIGGLKDQKPRELFQHFQLSPQKLGADSLSPHTGSPHMDQGDLNLCPFKTQQKNIVQHRIRIEGRLLFNLVSDQDLYISGHNQGFSKSQPMHEATNLRLTLCAGTLCWQISVRVIPSSQGLLHPGPADIFAQQLRNSSFLTSF